MAEYISTFVRDTRRALLRYRKKLDLKQYDFKVKTQMGAIETMNMQQRQRSLNLLDFERNREKDLFMIDVNSDRSEHGGVSETELSIMQVQQSDYTYRKFANHQFFTVSLLTFVCCP